MGVAVDMATREGTGGVRAATTVVTMATNRREGTGDVRPAMMAVVTMATNRGVEERRGNSITPNATQADLESIKLHETYVHTHFIYLSYTMSFKSDAVTIIIPMKICYNNNNNY